MLAFCPDYFARMTTPLHQAIQPSGAPQMPQHTLLHNGASRSRADSQAGLSKYTLHILESGGYSDRKKRIGNGG